MPNPSRIARALCTLALIAGVFPAARSVAHAPARTLVDPELRRQLTASKPTDRLLVFVHAADIGTARRAARAGGLSIVTTWDRIGVAVAAGTARDIFALTGAPGVTYLEANRALQFDMETANVATRTAQARQTYRVGGQPVDGRGVSIAIIDSGVDGTHPMFDVGGHSKVVQNLRLLCPSGLCDDPPAQVDDDQNDAQWAPVPSNDSDSPAGGHGTHVASLAAGVPWTTADGRHLSGAATGAPIIGLGVGAGLNIYGADSALDWVLRHHNDPCGNHACPPIRVINNSWGGGGRYDPSSATSKLVTSLVDDSVVVVFAAGNGDATGDGGDGTTLRTNAEAQDPHPGVISVANYDDGNSGTRDGGLDSSSSRGKRGMLDTYPDISAPGANITGACRPTLPVCTLLGGQPDTADPNAGTISGTSMAAPQIAGIVAMVLQANPALTPADVQDVLEDTAYKFAFGGPYEPDPANPDNTTSFDKGHGLVDTMAAVARALGLPAPGDPLPAITCAGGSRVAVDPPGDAPANLDLTGASLTWDGNALSVAIDVAGLAPQVPVGATGTWYDLGFTVGTHSLFVAAEHETFSTKTLSPDADAFHLGRQVGLQLDNLSDITGSFDYVNGVVHLVVTNTDIDAANAALVAAGEPGTIEHLVGGSRVHDMVMRSRETREVLLSEIDSGAASCAYVLGTGAA